MKCIVCKSSKVIFRYVEGKKYWTCKYCLAKFLDSKHHLDPLSEKKRYLEHNNQIKDEKYRKFLSRLLKPLEKKISSNDNGLEFGCGHGPALADMLIGNGYKVDLYDPFFFPNKDLLNKQYKFVTCTETVEHFFDPYNEFTLLDKLLLSGGWLGVMTCFLTADSQFDKWYYRKDPTHVVFYARETFEIIAEQRDWTCEIPTKDIVLFCKN